MGTSSQSKDFDLSFDLFEDDEWDEVTPERKDYEYMTRVQAPSKGTVAFGAVAFILVYIGILAAILAGAVWIVKAVWS